MPGSNASGKTDTRTRPSLAGLGYGLRGAGLLAGSVDLRVDVLRRRTQSPRGANGHVCRVASLRDGSGLYLPPHLPEPGEKSGRSPNTSQEEARGLVRWLRPEYQNPGGEQSAQGALVDGLAPGAVEAPRGRAPWPKTLPEQVRAVREALAEQPSPAAPEQVARTFKRAQTARVREMLETLESLGQVRRTEAGLYASG